MTPNGYASERSGPYWSNPPFLFFDIRALRRSVLSAGVPECQKNKNGGLDQYGHEHFVRLTFATIRKNAGMKELNRRTFLITDMYSICYESVHSSNCVAYAGFGVVRIGPTLFPDWRS